MKTRLAAIDYLDRKRCSRNFLYCLQNGQFCFTGNSRLSHLFQTTVSSNPISPGFCFLVSDNQNQNQKTKCLREVLPQQPKLSRKWASVTLICSLNPWISCVWSILSKGPPLPPSLTYMYIPGKSPKIPENL